MPDSSSRLPAGRVVIDTNILVGAMYRPESDSARVVAACLDGRIRAVVSPAIVAEYRHILPRAVRVGPDVGPRLEAFLETAEMVRPEAVPAVVAADPADDMLFAAALAGRAQAIVTNDRPVLQIGSHAGVAVVRPREMLKPIDGVEERPSADPSCAGPAAGER